MSVPTHRYDSDFTPPALVLDVELVHPDPKDKRRLTKKALIDTGADGSVIPAEISDQWNLHKTGEIITLDFHKKETLEPTYDVRIVVNALVSKIVEVTVANREDILLGRDILNELRMCADGKAQSFTLENP